MEMNGILASALIGVTVLIVGLIIIRLTPEERPKR
jgi:uncharacterized membrane-anchored protein YhcB (DUF1043 family)